MSDNFCEDYINDNYNDEEEYIKDEYISKCQEILETVNFREINIRDFFKVYFKMLIDVYLSEDELKYLEKLITGKMTIEGITDSSGSSTVFIGDDFVWQYFKNHRVADKICELYKKLFKNPIFEYNNKEYNIFDYIVPLEFSACDNSTSNYNSNVIIWKRIETLNKRSFIIDFEKLERDIIIALNGLHSMGYVHGDCTLDNIGYYNGNYVLFDFDMSKLATPEGIAKDFSLFYSSMKNRLKE